MSELKAEIKTYKNKIEDKHKLLANTLNINDMPIQEKYEALSGHKMSMAVLSGNKSQESVESSVLVSDRSLDKEKDDTDSARLKLKLRSSKGTLHKDHLEMPNKRNLTLRGVENKSYQTKLIQHVFEINIEKKSIIIIKPKENNKDEKNTQTEFEILNEILHNSVMISQDNGKILIETKISNEQNAEKIISVNTKESKTNIKPRKSKKALPGKDSNKIKIKNINTSPQNATIKKANSARIVNMQKTLENSTEIVERLVIPSENENSNNNSQIIDQHSEIQNNENSEKILNNENSLKIDINNNNNEITEKMEKSDILQTITEQISDKPDSVIKSRYEIQSTEINNEENSKETFEKLIQDSIKKYNEETKIVNTPTINNQDNSLVIQKENPLSENILTVNHNDKLIQSSEEVKVSGNSIKQENSTKNNAEKIIQLPNKVISISNLPNHSQSSTNSPNDSIPLLKFMQITENSDNNAHPEILYSDQKIINANPEISSNSVQISLVESQKSSENQKALNLNAHSEKPISQISQSPANSPHKKTNPASPSHFDIQNNNSCKINAYKIQSLPIVNIFIKKQYGSCENSFDFSQSKDPEAIHLSPTQAKRSRKSSKDFSSASKTVKNTPPRSPNPYLEKLHKLEAENAKLLTLLSNENRSSIDRKDSLMLQLPSSIKKRNSRASLFASPDNSKTHINSTIRKRRGSLASSKSLFDKDEVVNYSYQADMHDSFEDQILGFDFDNLSNKHATSKISRAMLLIKRLMQHPEKFKKTKRATPRIIHKFISKIYQDLLLLHRISIQSLETPFHLKHKFIDFVYQMLVNQYGIQLVADKKFIQLILGILAYSHDNIRLKLFGTFIGIWPSGEGELEFYLKGLYYLTKSCSIGLTIPNADSCDSQLVSVPRALDLIRKYFQPRLRVDEWLELKHKFDMLKYTNYKSSTNSTSAVDLDLVMNLALQKYKSLLGTMQDYVKDIFAACDVFLMIFNLIL